MRAVTMRSDLDEVGERGGGRRGCVSMSSSLEGGRVHEAVSSSRGGTE